MEDCTVAGLQESCYPHGERGLLELIVELSPMGSVNQYRCIQSFQYSSTAQSKHNCSIKLLAPKVYTTVPFIVVSGVGKSQSANPMHQQSDDTQMTLPSVVCLFVTAITDGESSLTNDA
ncbi:hypothetical protein OUZ56_009540 [Daphnia magna]|uniref:Uncharacterized protein n=1 Tax=Daphnia magna TaxID=35525 RepID=A0ABR0AGA1_9CRUS|nr:hypothetical protein OUZ56_009540 [Daphnia magna]